MKKLILLIDDDIDELYIFKEALKETGDNYECVFAIDVEQGISIVKNMLPDYIFLDINMPGVNGYEGLSRLRHMKIVEAVPVIMYSTAIDDFNINKAMALGAVAGIRKVNSITKLSHLLTQLFNGAYFVNDKFYKQKHLNNNSH